MTPFFLSFIFGLLAACALPATGPLPLISIPEPFSFIFFIAGFYGLFKLVTTALLKKKCRSLRTFAYGYLWAFGYFLLSLSWIGNALLIGGNPYAWAYPFALIGLPLLLSIHLGLASAVFAYLSKGASEGKAAVLFILLTSLAEYARGHLFTGFPWNLPAFIWSDTLPVFEVLSVTGPYGLSLLTLLWAMGVALIFGSERISCRILSTLAALTLGATLIYSHHALYAPTPTTANTVQAVLVQANIPQSEKWDGTKMIDHFYDHLERSRAPQGLKNQPTLILWPETALPPAFIHAPAITRAIKTVLSEYPNGSWLVTGALRAEGTSDSPVFYNSVIAFNKKGDIQILYDKHHLVPFGEYMPFQKYIPLAPITQFEGLARGDGPKTITLEKDVPPFSPLICYEVIFAGEVRAHNGPAPALIVNLTNDSWYGDTAGPRQHLAQARARAIEQGIPLLRAAGTGISAAIDAKGHFIAEIPYNSAGTQIAQISYDNDSKTFYQLYGDTPFLILLIVVLFIFSPKRRI